MYNGTGYCGLVAEVEMEYLPSGRSRVSCLNLKSFEQVVVEKINGMCC